MRLQSLGVRGYKRFAGENLLFVRSRLVAIVGPNEAGKTSLLRAFEHLSRREGFDRREFTDRVVPDPQENPIVVSARFGLEAADYEALGSLVPEETEDGPPFFEIRKRANGQIRSVLSAGGLRRDRSRRKGLQAALETLAHGKRTWLARLDEAREDDAEGSLRERVADVATTLADAGEDLGEERIAQLRTVANEIAEVLPSDAPKAARDLAERVQKVADLEDLPNPKEQARTLLHPRIPDFLFFEDEQERWLEPEYIWSEHEVAPPPLENLCALAGADYGHLRGIAQDPDRADELHSEQLRINQNLEERFAVWTQEELWVAFWMDHERLRLQIHDQALGKLTRLDERSAGLRWFCALIAFTAQRSSNPHSRPVLLIDEAETHLHYGGQADLVKVFERQQAAQTIIYTTHSIGCLPSDLGTAIRAASPSGPERSEIHRSVWTGTPVGLSPIVLAMGANTLAFTPARYAVIGEGVTEAMLLPSLFREARGAEQADEPLGFQVAPGIAEVEPEYVEGLEHEAGKVLYLIDSDKGGRGHKRKLPKRAKQEGRVIELGRGTEDGLCTEDLVDSELLARAVNLVIQATRDTVARVDAKDLPVVGRGRWLIDWCNSAEVEELNKALIAERILDIGLAEGGIVEVSRVPLLNELREVLVQLLEPQESGP